MIDHGRKREREASSRWCDLDSARVRDHSHRVIEVQWGAPKADGAAVYPVDVAVEAADRQGLLRDISELFAKEKMNVIGVQTQSVRGTAWMTFTVEVAASGRLH